MLSDLSVSTRHQRRLRAKLEVCFKRCVKSVLGPHHSGEIMRRPQPKSNATGTERSNSPMIYSDQDGFQPQTITQVCVCVALAPRHNRNTRACSSLMCCCYDKGQNSDVQREQTCNSFFGGFNGKNTVTSVVVRVVVKLTMLMRRRT